MTAAATTRPVGQTPATFAVDVGGTWTRSRRLDDQATTHRVATPSVLRRPGAPVSVLRDDLVTLLAGLAPADAVVAVSLGAALDDRTGVVLGSAPLWGSADDPVDLRAALSRRRPDVAWHLVNDVTAAVTDVALRHAPPAARYVGYLTVSSGIAFRRLDVRRRRVEVDERGVQGEVGHVGAQVGADEADLLLARCECGGRGHLAAISSGPGLGRLVMRRRGPTADPVATLGEGLAAGERWADDVLRSAIAPVAGLVRTLWALDPHLDLLALGGGVVEGLGAAYEQVLRDQLRAPSSYADLPRDDAWFETHLRCCAPGEVDLLAGAAAVVAGAAEMAR